MVVEEKRFKNLFGTRVLIPSFNLIHFYFCIFFIHLLSLLIIYYTFYQSSFFIVFDLDDFINKYVSLFKRNLKNFLNKNY